MPDGHRQRGRQNFSKICIFKHKGSVKDRNGLEMIEAPERDLTLALEGILGCLARADAIIVKFSDAVIPQLYTNSAHPGFHRKTTAKPIGSTLTANWTSR